MTYYEHCNAEMNKALGKMRSFKKGSFMWLFWRRAWDGFSKRLETMTVEEAEEKIS